MGDRVEELKGNLKRGAGKLTGDERMEAEGGAQATTAKAAREGKGAIQEGVGAVKEGVGDLLDNERLQAEGAADRLKGKANRAG